MNRTTREQYNDMPLGCYHLCFERLEGRNIFTCDQDYRMGMAGVALSTIKYGVDVFAFELMPNHLHDIMRGTGAQCMQVVINEICQFCTAYGHGNTHTGSAGR